MAAGATIMKPLWYSSLELGVSDLNRLFIAIKSTIAAFTKDIILVINIALMSYKE